jgi:hypothetical protein
MSGLTSSLISLTLSLISLPWHLMVVTHDPYLPNDSSISKWIKGFAVTAAISLLETSRRR